MLQRMDLDVVTKTRPPKAFRAPVRAYMVASSVASPLCPTGGAVYCQGCKEKVSACLNRACVADLEDGRHAFGTVTENGEGFDLVSYQTGARLVDWQAVRRVSRVVGASA